MESINFDRFSTSLPSRAVTGIDGPVRVTQSPVTTGSSVLGMAFKDGVIIAADTLGSYGSMARFKNLSRLMDVGGNILLGCTGDFADFQYLKAIIEQISIDDSCKDDGFKMGPRSLHSWITRVLYNKRSKFDPLWTNFVVGGLDEDTQEPFLGFVDKIGTAYKDPIIATGYGAYLATPMMRKAVETNPNMTEDQVKSVIAECMKVLFYRDARSLQKYQIGIITKEGVKIEGPISVEENWEIAHTIKGYE